MQQTRATMRCEALVLSLLAVVCAAGLPSPGKSPALRVGSTEAPLRDIGRAAAANVQKHVTMTEVASFHGHLHGVMRALRDRLGFGDVRFAAAQMTGILGVSLVLLAYFAHKRAASKLGKEKLSQVLQVEQEMHGVLEEVRTKQLDLSQSAHHLSIDELEGALCSSLQHVRLASDGSTSMGLDDATAALHHAAFGSNQMTPPERENCWVLLLKQVFGGLFNIMLWSCVACELVLYLVMHGDDVVTPIVLSLVIFSSGALQWWTEQQAEGMMSALQEMQASADLCAFRRQNGKTVEVLVAVENLVPGDVILLESGQKVPADVRILACSDGSLVDNSALTGESLAEPRASETASASINQVEAKNIAFCGTVVLQGRMMCVVFGTGDRTFLGQIATKIRTSRTRSSLEIQIEHFIHIIAIVAMCVGALSLVANIMSPRVRGAPEILENAATAFFAQVPEGLLPTVTVCLMIASQKMAARHVLVRKIDAVETLGCVGVLCSDKTGTLTSGKMTASDLVAPCPEDGHLLELPLIGRKQQDTIPESFVEFASSGVLNTTAKSDNAGGFTGSPTETAIIAGCYALLGKERADSIRASHPQVFEIPFNSGTKWMLTAHALGGEDATSFLLLVKGAPERVLDMCNTTPNARMEIEACLTRLMSQGKRVLCIAEKRMEGLAPGFKFSGGGPADANFPLDGFHFQGLVALEDPPKAGVIDAIDRIARAGTRTIMVTGDHPGTAEAIARRIGIIPEDSEEDLLASGYRVVTGAQLEDRMPEGDIFDTTGCSKDPEAVDLALFWRRCVEHTRVFARVSPMHKRIIVRAYQSFGGEITAMTGDGVNDAPALKEAEVGIAMGIRGTEVAKEAADIVLLDDDLQSVVEGIEQGRLCSENLRKSIMYTMCSKLPQVLPTFAELLGVPSALTCAQVLLIDIGTDIWTAIAYAWQPAESELMERAPRHPKKDRMVNGGVLMYSYGYIGVIQSLACWMVFLFGMPRMYALFHEDKHPSQWSSEDIEADYAGMTGYYWTLVLGQVGAALATTTMKQSIFNFGLPNRSLNWCLVLEILLALLIISWSPLQNLFKTRMLTVPQFCIGASGFLLISVAEEMRKYALRRREAVSKAH